MRRSVDQVTAASVAAVLGLLVAVAVGAWWTATAVVDGNTTAVMMRLVVSVAGGFYYLTMYRVATGRALFSR